MLVNCSFIYFFNCYVCVGVCGWGVSVKFVISSVFIFVIVEGYVVVIIFFMEMFVVFVNLFVFMFIQKIRNLFFLFGSLQFREIKISRSLFSVVLMCQFHVI